MAASCSIKSAASPPFTTTRRQIQPVDHARRERRRRMKFNLMEALDPRPYLLFKRIAQLSIGER
jgi:hypothetical protein